MSEPAPRPPVLVAGPRGHLWLSPDGEADSPAAGELVRRLAAERPLVCHRPSLRRRLGLPAFAAFDLLELWAFLRPAQLLVPSPTGLALRLGLAAPAGLEAEALVLLTAAGRLLGEALRTPHRRQALALAVQLARVGWPWGELLLHDLGFDPAKPPATRGLEAWELLPRWEEEAPPPPARQLPVDPAEARRRLAELVGAGAEDRPQQADYASALAAAFRPREQVGEPHLVLAEAGTGVGKTLGYLAPASLWAERNDGTVHLSTFTRNLQQQLDQELSRLYPDLDEKAAKVVIRKGRENYLCLLNYAEAVTQSLLPEDLLALALMARWQLATRDGDMVGGDFPGWLPDLVGRSRTLGLTDRRGECIYSACPHYHRCFIEQSLRRARRARLVVANHALVLAQAAGAGEEAQGVTRLVFDEGHHLFEAADSAFAQHLSGQETAELRRWILGADRGRSATRLRGLRRRLEELVADDEEAAPALDALLMAARMLPAEGWRQRLEQGASAGAAERFLLAVSQQVLARAERVEEGYDLECDVDPPAQALLEAAQRLDAALYALQEPVGTLIQRLGARLDEEAETLSSDERRRLEGAVRMLERRARDPVLAWRAILASLEGERPDHFVDWLALERRDGRAQDVGLYRHWRDPMVPFAATVLREAHGLAVTSATLTDSSGDSEADWRVAERRSGVPQAGIAALRARVLSPFDYAHQTRLFIVRDLNKSRIEQLAAACRALMVAAGGGALGLFTSIARLRGVHRLLAPAMAEAGLALYAQHVDPFDTSTLVDIFRAEVDASLLGTDAVRDGVDVPGRSLRLVIFDRVPWPRPDIRHRARREVFGGRLYDEEIVRRRLRQAFGRLIRRADDRGVFVLLDGALPTRLLSAFPEGVPVARVGLAEAAAATRAFLSQPR